MNLRIFLILLLLVPIHAQTETGVKKGTKIQLTISEKRMQSINGSSYGTFNTTSENVSLEVMGTGNGEPDPIGLVKTAVKYTGMKDGEKLTGQSNIDRWQTILLGGEMSFKGIYDTMPYSLDFSPPEDYSLDSFFSDNAYPIFTNSEKDYYEELYSNFNDDYVNDYGISGYQVKESATLIGSTFSPMFSGNYSGIIGNPYGDEFSYQFDFKFMAVLDYSTSIVNTIIYDMSYTITSGSASKSFSTWFSILSTSEAPGFSLPISLISIIAGIIVLVIPNKLLQK